MRQLHGGERCEAKDCARVAEHVVARHHRNEPVERVTLVCKVHRDRMLGYDSPEYEVECPSCHCEFGV